MNDPRVQAMFKRSRQKNLTFSIISEDYFELPKRTIRARGSIYHIIKPNIFRDLQNLYEGKASMNMTPNELKLLTSTCWNEKYQPLTNDMIKHKNTGGYRLGFNKLFVPDTNPFYTLYRI